MDASKDYYRVLGVESSASQDEVKRAFREQAKRCHPDRHPGDRKAARRFREINEAYQVLGDAKERRRYDQLRLLGVGFSPDIEYGVDLNDIKEQLAAGMSNVKEYFSGWFAGSENEGEGTEARADGAEKGRRGRDLTYRVSISLEKSLEGGKATFSVPALRGGGRRRLTVEVPPGIREGKKIRLEGQGHPGKGGGPNGDLYLKIHVLPHADYEIRGEKLIYRTHVDLRTLVLGGEVSVPTPTGGSAKVGVPPLTQPGSLLAVDGQVGLEVEVGLRLPESLDDDAREAFAAFCERAGIGDG